MFVNLDAMTPLGGFETMRKLGFFEKQAKILKFTGVFIKKFHAKTTQGCSKPKKVASHWFKHFRPHNLPQSLETPQMCWKIFWKRTKEFGGRHSISSVLSLFIHQSLNSRQWGVDEYLIVVWCRILSIYFTRLMLIFGVSSSNFFGEQVGWRYSCPADGSLWD